MARIARAGRPPFKREMAMTKPPAHLEKATAQWFAAVVDDYSLEEHHVRLLIGACEAWDRAQEARTTVEAEGAYFTDRSDQPKAHPAVAVERDSRTQFARLLRELDLEGEPLPSPHKRRS